MRAAIYDGPHSIELGERPDPVLASPTDAVVRVVLACVCGSDLWYYRGESPHALGPIGHEFMGVVDQVGSAVRGIGAGDLVIAPFTYSDGTCAHCRAGWTSNCIAGGAFGSNGIDGRQGEAVRVPFAGSTLVRVPGEGHSDDTLRSLLTLSDVMCTGHHAAVSASVKHGDTIAVVGDGAVGLCAIIASRRLGAARIIALSRNRVRDRAPGFGRRSGGGTTRSRGPHRDRDLPQHWTPRRRGSGAQVHSRAARRCARGPYPARARLRFRD
jgi:threonine dehydrogenase-like Zn-dependent dehydrogenase